MKLTGIKTIALAVLLSSASAQAQEMMSLKDCMVYAVEKSAKMKMQMSTPPFLDGWGP